ncbi:hypothetical protein RUND412_002650 [Rhizina undulata]
MSDKNIKEGDEVSWKYGAGEATGTVSEIATTGTLTVDTADKKVSRKASASNPAVHVSRDGNDVAKRASELSKEPSGDAGKAPEQADNSEKKTPEEHKAEKRERDDEGKREGEKEKEGGKVVKKPKLDDDANGQKTKSNGNGTAKKGENGTDGKAEKAPAEPPKKRGPGRPKKAELEARRAAEAANAAKNGESKEKVSSRTRSKR